MGVGTNDHIHAPFQHFLGEVPLYLAFIELIFIAPVHDGDDKVGVHFFSFPDIGMDGFFFDEVDDSGFSGRDAVSAIRIIEKSQAKAILGYKEGVERIAAEGIPESTCLVEAERLNGFNRVEHSIEPCIVGVVVGGDEKVEAGIAEGGGQGIGASERRISGIGWFTGEGDFEVSDGEVRRL